MISTGKRDNDDFDDLNYTFTDSYPFSSCNMNYEFGQSFLGAGFVHVFNVSNG